MAERNPDLKSYAPMEAWSWAFSSGYDFLGRLKPFGLNTDAEVRAAMPAAWTRLGLEYLAWRGELPAKPGGRPPPFALLEHGPPPRRKPTRFAGGAR